MSEEGIGSSPLDSLINMEISMLQDASPVPESGRVVGLNEAKVPHQEMRDKAQQIFAPEMWDPAMEKSKVDDVVNYAIQDCGAENPRDMINLLNTLYQNAGGRGVFLDTCWGHIQRLRFLRASRNMETRVWN